MTDHVIMPGADYKAICDAVREKTGGTEPLKSGDIPGEIEKIESSDANDSYQLGYADGKTDGIEQGKQTEYDLFWDNYQNYGKRASYAYGFYGESWNDTIFKPKYDIICGEWDSAVFDASGIADLKGILEKQGVTLDTSQVKTFTRWFNYSDVTHVPPLDMISGTSCLNLFNTAQQLQEVDLNNISEVVAGHNTIFQNCVRLTTVRMTGTLGTSGWNFNWSPLSVESMKNIIGCLKNFTGTGSENTCLIKFNEDCWNALEADSKAPDGNTWKDYVQFTLCWNI